MQQLQFFYNIVENAIAKLGIDPQVARRPKAGQWTIRKGQVPVWIDVFHSQQEQRIYFQVASPIMKMPHNGKAELALELLELNNLLYGVAFCTSKGNLFIKTIREAEGLDLNEAHAMILRVGNYADKYDDQLRQKYPDWAQTAAKSRPVSDN